MDISFSGLIAMASIPFAVVLAVIWAVVLVIVDQGVERDAVGGPPAALIGAGPMLAYAAAMGLAMVAGPTPSSQAGHDWGVVLDTAAWCVWLAIGLGVWLGVRALGPRRR